MDDDDTFSELLSEFNQIQLVQREERNQCLEDRRFCFISGAQWEDKYGKQFENKPRLETNKVRLSVLRILNEYKNNRIGVSFVSRDGVESKDLSDTCSALYRSCEQDSISEEAYDNAFLEALSGGFGAWRIHQEYANKADYSSTEQHIRISPIHDADKYVFFDLGAKRQDKKDAKKCFIVHSMTRDDYREKYKKDPTEFRSSIGGNFDWTSSSVTHIAEVYVKEESKERVYTFEELDGKEVYVLKSDYDERAPFLIMSGAKEIRSKVIVKEKVRKYVIDGGGILEDCGCIAGSNIPVVPVYGTYLFIDNSERISGHVRVVKDVQRLKNMQISKLAEIAGISAVEKPIFTAEQIAGHQQQWAREHIDNYAYMLINPLIDQNGNSQVVGPAAFTKPPQVPPATAALIGLAEQDIKDLLGNSHNGEDLQTQQSGRAIELIHSRLDMQSFNYIANMSRAIRRSAEIWLGMAKEVYVERNRKLRGISNEGGYTGVVLKVPKLDKNMGLVYANNLEEADFDVVATVGPSSMSRKQAIVRSLTGMLQFIQDQETVQVISSMILANMEGEGIEEVRKFFKKKLIRIGVLDGTPEEMESMSKEPQKPIDPQSQFMLASSQQAAAMAQKAQADTQLSLAKADEIKSKLTLMGANSFGR